MIFIDNVLDDLVVVKRSGQRVNFNGTKVAIAIKNAFDSVDDKSTTNDINKVYEDVLNYIKLNYTDRKTINVEDIQDIIEEKLKQNNYNLVYESFNSYRLRRAASRDAFSEKQQHKFVKAIENLGLQNNKNMYDRPMETMIGFGKSISKEFAKAYILENKYVRAHDEGTIFINDLSYFPLCTISSTHLDFSRIEEDNIEIYLFRLVNIISNCKKEQTGEQAIDAFDVLLSRVVINSFKSILKRNIANYLKLSGFLEFVNIKQINYIVDRINTIDISTNIFDQYINSINIKNVFESSYKDAKVEIELLLNKTIKDFLNSINNLDNELGNNKVVITIGNNEMYEASLIKNIYIEVLNELDTLENVTTIYKIGKIDELDENIIKLITDNKNICFSLNHNAEYLSNGEKIYANINDDVLSSSGRGIISTTSINLARIGIVNRNKTLDEFYQTLTEVLDFTRNQLIQRFELQANKYQKSFPNLFKNKLLLDSDKLDEEQKIRKVIKNGVLNIGLVGLNECVMFLPENNKKKLMDNILKFINNKIIQYTNDTRLNFIVTQTEDEKILKEFLEIDKSIYGNGLFPSNIDRYSLLNNYDVDLLETEYNNIQDYINLRINVYLRKNSSDKKIIEAINTMKNLGILYFKIIVGKNDN